MRSVLDQNCPEPLEAADAVIDMHNEIACREAREFRDEVAGPPRLAGPPHKPVADDVLFSDECELGGLEAMLQSEHDRAYHIVWPGLHFSPTGSTAIGATP